MSQELVELRWIGDRMQSEASRLVMWIRTANPQGMPYEVCQAVLEIEDAVAQWTDARTSYATEEAA